MRQNVKSVLDLGYAIPSTTRSRLVLEVASELAGRRGWKEKQARVTLREQGPGDWTWTLLGSEFHPPDTADIRR